MGDEPEVLSLADVVPAKARQAFRAVAAVLSARLPYAEIVHVGSTAVPGCLTKGDLDVLVRVDCDDFGRASLTLDDLLPRSPRNERTDDYGEYDYSADGASAAVQLVVAGSILDDRFRRLKAILTSDPQALDRYNALKLRCAGGSMAAYRDAKHQLIEALLLADTAAGRDRGRAALLPGIHE